MQNQQYKQFMFEKSYKVGKLPIYCGVTAMFYGGYCWKYKFLPTLEQKQKLLADSKTALDQALQTDGYTIIMDSITRVSFEENLGRFFMTATDNDKITYQTQTSLLTEELKERETIDLNESVGILFRSNGTGVSYFRRLRNYLSGGLLYVHQGSSTGRSEKHEVIKYANDFGLQINGYLERESLVITNLFAGLRGVYSSRKNYSNIEDEQQKISYSTAKSMYYADVLLGFQMTFFDYYQILFQGGVGAELGPHSEHRQNYDTFEGQFGYHF